MKPCLILQPVFVITLLPFYLAAAFTTSGRDESLSSGSGDIIESIQNLLIKENDKHSLTRTDQKSGDLNSIVGLTISILNCGPFLNSPNSHLQYSVDYSANRLKLFQECDRYYNTTQKKDSLEVHCRYNKWVINNKINCQGVTCPQLTPPALLSLSTKENTFNTTVYFWCLDGYRINGTAYKVNCQENGQWNSPLPSCEMSFCRPLSPPLHGSISSTKEIGTNQTLRFFCQGKYSLIGDAVLRCRPNGRWNTSAPVCLRVCKIPDFAQQLHLRVLPSFESPRKRAIKPGKRVVYTCRQPGSFASSGISTCVVGRWKPPIACTKACIAQKIANGTFVLSKGATTIEYYCLPGYELVGPSKLVCNKTQNTWDHQAPVCRKVSLCTLKKTPLFVLSYHNITTYEEIPDGATIRNGAKVYSICRKGIKNFGITECIDGKIYPPRDCADSRFKTTSDDGLMAFDESSKSWGTLCFDANINCNIFGFNETYMKRCRKCYKLDHTLYTEQSVIRLRRIQRQSCLACR